MMREKKHEMIGQSTALRTERMIAAYSAVRRFSIEMLGRIHAINQKLNAVIRNSATWRRSGIRPGLRRPTHER